MKIVFVVWNTSCCGGTRAIFEIANRLNKKYKVEIISLIGNHNWFPLKTKVTYIDTFKRIQYPLMSKIFKDSRILRNKFYENMIDLSESIPDCDICIATWYPTALSVWYSHIDKPFYFLQDFTEQFNNNYDISFFDSTLRLPFYFLTNSNYTKEIILKVQPKAKSKVVGVGVNRNIFYPRENYMIEEEKKKIMVFMRGLNYKGDDIAIKSMNLINKKIPIHANIVSPTINSKRLFNKYEPSFSYTLFNRIDDDKLAKLYSLSDLFLYTSYAEGFGLPPLESMSCGTPVITTDCKGNRDYIQNGINCFVVKPGDYYRIFEKAEKILNNNKLSDILIKNGIITAKKWNWEDVITKFNNAFNEHKSNEVHRLNIQ